MQSLNLHQANALVKTLKNLVESTVAASIKRHVANATFNTNGNQGTINNTTNLHHNSKIFHQATWFRKSHRNMSQTLQE